MPLRIAFADNDPEFLETRSELLRQAGFALYTAASVPEARRILDQQWIHVGVFDIRMEDNTDEEDISGIILARDPQYQTIPKIILTAYPTWQNVRDALSPRLHDLTPAVAYVYKGDGALALIDAIHRIAQEFLHINWSLKTHWRSPGLSYTALAQQFVPSCGVTELVDFAAELEDLFRMLFSTYSQITIDRQLWQQPGRVALVVFAFNEGSPGRQLVVTCGRRDVLQREHQSHNRLAEAGALTGIPQRVNHRATLHFAANAVELPGSDLETIKTFTETYASSNARDIRVILQNLNPSGTSLWQSQRRIAMESNLGALLRQRLQLDSPEQTAIDLDRQITALNQNAATTAVATITRSPDALRVMVSAPQRRSYTLPDPVSWIAQAEPFTLETPVLLANTLGSLRSDSLLVDSNGHIWLSDLLDVAEGPIIADFAALETSLKAELTTGENLSDLVECELLLMAPDRLTDRGESGPNALQKVMAAVRAVRTLAASLVGDDLEPYLIALAYQAIRRILAYDPATARAQKDVTSAIHACLSLGIILQRLSALRARAQSGASPHSTGLHLDETNRQARVDGKIISLGPTEYQLLHYLWQHRQQLCRRGELYEAVYSQPYRPGRTQPDDAQLNMLIKRLREAIEPDPGNPLYLVTRRGEGYTLYPEGRLQA